MMIALKKHRKKIKTNIRKYAEEAIGKHKVLTTLSMRTKSHRL